MKRTNTLKEYLNKLTKSDLIDTINYYHSLCEIFDYSKSLTITSEKKNVLIEYFLDLKETFLELFIMTLDKNDFNSLKQLIKKDSALGVDNVFLKYLNNIHILFENELPIDTKETLKKLIKSKKYASFIKKNDKYYSLATGIIIAYGVIELETFKKIINNNQYYKLITIRYKNDFIIDHEKVVSISLKNQNKIKKYFNDNELRSFNNTEFIALGQNNYHHLKKSYKKLIKILKRNYIFKNYDIIFLDNVIITPYLYSSLNEEKIVSDNLKEAIEKYFEFSNDKLKKLIINYISMIKMEFPLWQYRGRSIEEVK